MTAPRRNEVVPFIAGTACRVADFELRTGVKIEQAILDFLDDQIFALTDVPPAPSREPSTSRE